MSQTSAPPGTSAPKRRRTGANPDNLDELRELVEQLQTQLNAKPAMLPKAKLKNFDGSSVNAAREFIDKVQTWVDASPWLSDLQQRSFLKANLEGGAFRWFCMWSSQHPDADFAAVVEAFRATYVSSREVQALALQNLLGARQRTTIEQFFDYIQQQLAALSEDPTEATLIQVFIKGLSDTRVADELLRNPPATLNEAFQAALRVDRNRRSSRMPLSNRNPPA